ncbi:bifunctional diguanylate cyclase/phosphodiesterase [Selenomonas sp.]|uniref:bifunctional diguanylate cyclase/phosphodiesterase n=1 Tax=Selenomonas sp. TaxID=2053611 RepID=UPI003FA20555
MRRTDRVTLSPLLKRLKLYFDLLKRTTSGYLYVVDMENKIAMVSPNIVRDFGIPAETMDFLEFRQAWRSIMHPTECARVTGIFDEVLQGRMREGCIEFRAKMRKGSYEWVECRCAASFAYEGKGLLYAGIFRLMGQRTHADAVTGLLSKYQLEQRMKEALDEARETGRGGALMIIGIDNFKIINEVYNRSFGDQVLREVAHRIRRILATDFRLYKLDGDEFGIVYPGARKADVEALYKSIQTALSEPQKINDRKYFCTVSGGAVFFPQFGKDYLVLHKYAEAALSFAKQSGKNKNVLFSKELYNRWLRSLTAHEDIRRSVEDDCRGFSLCFQPQVHAVDQRIIGAEALLRWQNSKGRMVAPMEFIPLLEESQLMIPVGKWIADTAVRICRDWQRRVPDFRMSINLSYVQLRDPSFKDAVKSCVERYGVAPESIVLELTERTVIADWNFINREFSSLREYGLKIAMDDFGTGCSSLEMFKNLACDIVKIDRAFVKEILSSDFDRRIVEYTVALCHSVGMSVCIEGVETWDEYELLSKSCKVDSIQGYLFGRPETQEGFEEKFLRGKEPS